MPFGHRATTGSLPLILAARGLRPPYPFRTRTNLPKRPIRIPTVAMHRLGNCADLPEIRTVNLDHRTTHATLIVGQAIARPINRRRARNRNEGRSRRSRNRRRCRDNRSRRRRTRRRGTYGEDGTVHRHREQHQKCGRHVVGPSGPLPTARLTAVWSNIWPDFEVHANPPAPREA